MDFLKFATLLIFLVAYILMVGYYNKKARIIWAAVMALLLLTVISPMEALFAINGNVLGIYIGMLFISEVFIFSKVPDFLAVKLVNKASRMSTVLILVAVLSGLLSIAIENVAVVLIVAPIALALSKKLEISPVPLLTAVAISSNLQGVATLIGDPPSMLLAGFAKMTFNDFFFFDGKPSLFFAVQIGAAASLFVLYYFFRRHSKPHQQFEEARPRSFFPLFLLLFLVLALAFSSFLDPEFRYMAGLISMVFALAAVIWYSFQNKPDVQPMLKRVDWETGAFLAGVFIVVDSLIKVGVVQDMARLISGFTGTSVFFTYIVIVVASLVFSAFVDNVPYIATMLPVVYQVSEIMHVSPYLFYFGLLIGASVGGNITPIGASANIVAMGIAKKEGHNPRFWEFVKMGLPFTIVSATASSVFVYLWFA
ncbi:citrate transporter [Candidatus Woesearchaeota archaeon]|nr:citrate transporter [Candidatus Woesearchaeota archaeon]